MEHDTKALAKSICVIGAGGAGLAAVKALSERGFHVDCYERGSSVGGNWRYQNDSGTSAAYASLRCNVSRRRMQFRSLPMPSSFGDFPSHADMTAYFEAFAERFALRRHIRFATTVASVAPDNGGGWELTLQNDERAHYDAVVVANGHHWSPHWPPLPGAPTVPVVHSHAYRTPDRFTGQRVLIIGAGQSAIEIATEISRVAHRTLLSVRSGAHLLPRYILGQPFDGLDLDLINRLPWRMLNSILRVLVRASAPGDVTRYGLRAPRHRILEQIPVVSSDLFAALRSGAMVVRPAIHGVAGSDVTFPDGSVDTVDAIVCATGYCLSFPFLPPAVLQPSGHAVPLYRRIVAPDRPGLYFIGLVDAPAGLLPIVEMQSEWLADVLAGGVVLPSSSAMWRAIDAGEPRSRERFPREPRHSIRCDPHAYLRLLARDRRRARRQRSRAAAMPTLRRFAGGGPDCGRQQVDQRIGGTRNRA